MISSLVVFNNWRNPNRIEAQVLDIVEMISYTLESATAILA